MVTRRLGGALLLTATLALLALIAILLGSSERRVAALQRAVAIATPYELRLQEARLALHPLRLQADLLQLRYPKAAEPALLSIQQLDVAVPIARLFGRRASGGHFSALNVSYYFDGSGTSAPVDLEGLLAPLAWLPEHIGIGSVHLISRSENVWIFPLLHVSGQRTDSDAMALLAEADIARQRVALEALVAWRLDGNGDKGLDVDATLATPNNDSRLELHGRVEADGAALHYETTLTGSYARIGDFATLFGAGAYAFAGKLFVDGELHGDLDGYVLSIRDLSIATSDSNRFSARGQVTRRSPEAARLRLEVRGEATHLAELLPLPGDLAALLDRSELRLAIEGPIERPSVRGAAIELFGAGNLHITLANPELDLSLDALRDATSIDTTRIEATVRVGDLPRLLAAAGAEPTPGMPDRALLQGELRAEGSDITAHLRNVTMEAARYRANGRIDALWQRGTLSIPALRLDLTPVAGGGGVAVSGSVGDLAALRGVVLDIAIDDLDPALVTGIAGLDSPIPGARARVTGSLRILKAADTIWLRDIDTTLTGPANLRVETTGTLSPDAGAPEADLHIALTGGTTGAWRAWGLPLGPDSASASLRLRTRYATLLGSLRRGTTTLQAVANADLDGGTIAHLGVDLYTPELRVEDFAVSQDADRFSAGDRIDTAPGGAAASAPYPVHLTLRSERVQGAHAGLDNLSIGVRGDAGRFLLEHFDSRYAGGELLLRGIADFSTVPPAFSLGGQGIRVPLAALTRDLGLQESVTGELSLRAGLSMRGSDSAGLISSVAGGLAVAVSNTQVSGPAYDLLMTNLLAWLVQGSSRKTTTFDCIMAGFDIRSGVARTDSLYIDTPRMIATGKGQLDLNNGTLDLRIEPRSRTRTFQFPSAVRLRGPVTDPRVSVSELQATADLSAQALLLLPSLTLKLFGIGSADNTPRPCQPRDAGPAQR